MTTMGEMMNIIRQRQDIQRGGVALQKEQAVLQPEIARIKAESTTAQVQSQREQWKLKSDQAAKGYELAGALLQNPAIIKGDSKGSVEALMQSEDRMRSHGIPEDVIRVQMGPMYMLAGHNPEKLRQVLADTVRSGLGAPGQAAQGLVPAGQQQQVDTNPVTQSPQTTSRDQFGQVTGVTPTPTPPSGGGGGGERIPTFQPGEPQEIPARTQERVAVNAAASKVPEQHLNNRQIIKLADTAYTGTGSSQWAKVMGAMGIQNVSGNEATDFQRMQHFMALQAISASSAMGAGTDAARDLASAATSKDSWTRDAVVSTAKVNDALASGLENYNIGMENAIKAAGGNVLAARDFKNAWSKVYDVRVMQLHNALESGDKKEVEKIVKDVGGAKSAGAAALLKKKQMLDNLISTGRL